jgi:hypothetical protein
MLPIYRNLEQGDALSPFFLILEYFIREGPEKQVGLKQMECISCYVNLLEHNMNTIKRNTGAVIDASKKVGIEVNAEEINMLISPECRVK